MKVKGKHVQEVGNYTGEKVEVLEDKENSQARSQSEGEDEFPGGLAVIAFKKYCGHVRDQSREQNQDDILHVPAHVEPIAGHEN